MRFGEIGVEVIARILLCPLTVGDSPNCVQLPPQLRQAAETMYVIRAMKMSPNLVFLQVSPKNK